MKNIDINESDLNTAFHQFHLCVFCEGWQADMWNYYIFLFFINITIITAHMAVNKINM